MAKMVPEDHDQRAAALKAALHIGAGQTYNEIKGYSVDNTDGNIVVKNAELFLKFLKGDNNG